MAVSKFDGLVIEQGHVVGVNFKSKNLTGIPTGLLAFSQLKSVDLSHNNLTGNAGLLAAQLPNLTSLNFSYNQFSDLYPMISPNVTSLDISHQTIDKTIDFDIAHLNIEQLAAQIPTIVLYDHANQRYNTDLNFICTTSEAESFNYNNTDQWALQLSYKNGLLTMPYVSSQNTFYGHSGDTLKVFALDKNSNLTGSNFHLRFFFEQGDANFVNGVDATDLQATILYAFGNYNSRPFNFTAADTYRDQNINVQDVVCTVNILLDKTPALALQDVMRKTRSRNGNDVTEEACVYVENGQVLLYTTRPVAVLDVMTSNPVKWNVGQYGLQQSSTNSHLVGYSLSGACLPVGTTVLGTVEGDTHIICVSLSDENARPITVTTNKDTVTGIDSVSTETDSSELIYDLMGRRINTIGNGINIIKNANGVKKVINRNK